MANTIKDGTTSACAENTRHNTCYRESFWNYLRVRGEYLIGVEGERIPKELPPRARRIPPSKHQDATCAGTTSACAENTENATVQIKTAGNYLRVRGEYHSQVVTASVPWELPPRARRILNSMEGAHLGIGTTSACAKNTLNELGLL